MLTPTEWRIVDAVRHGMRGREIALRRGVSVDAVKFHVANALAKLGLPDRVALRAWRGVPADSALRRQDTEKGQCAMGLRLGAIGQIARHVSDVDRAVEWYGTVLGLPHLYTFGDLAFFDCGGVRLFLSRSDDDTKAAPSLLYFRVDDIQSAYDQLRDRGVAFDGAPHMIFRHESGTEEWMAFFADPDGHPLAIMSQVAN